MAVAIGQIVVTVTATVEVPPLLRLRVRIANLLVGVAKWLVECKVTVNVAATCETSPQKTKKRRRTASTGYAG